MVSSLTAGCALWQTAFGCLEYECRRSGVFMTLCSDNNLSILPRMPFRIRAFALILVTWRSTEFRDTSNSDESVLTHDETKRQEEALFLHSTQCLEWLCVWTDVGICSTQAAETMEPALAAPGNLMTCRSCWVLGNTDNRAFAYRHVCSDCEWGMKGLKIGEKINRAFRLSILSDRQRQQV